MRSGTSFAMGSLLLLAWAGGATAVLGAGPTELPSGSEALSELDRIVVVYPASPAESVDVRALSAKRRAGFLTSLFGYPTEAVSDDAVTEEQRRQHLLVLGWDNRLLDALGPPRPFVQRGEARVFLDGVRIEPGEDLLFTVSSPFDPGRRLFFWSRIDLDLDKFSVLPFLGSDWAVYRGYEVTRQGMFLDDARWPPTRNELAQAAPGDFRPQYPVQGRSAHYVVHYPPGLVDDSQRAEILTARERALASAASFLKVPTDDVRIDLYLFADAATKERLTGVPDPVHSLGRSQELHMLPAHARSPNAHEETHLLAYRRFGPCLHTSLHEGLPLALERSSGDTSLSVYAAAIVAANGVPSIATLLDEDGVRSMNRGGVGFPASGLFVSWILDTGGLDLLGRAYAHQPLAADALAAELGVSVPSLDQSFAAWVAERAREGDLEYRFQHAVALAGAMGQQGDWSAAVDSLKAALELRPGDADTLYRLALAEDKSGQPAAAEQTLRTLLDRSHSESAVAERYVIFGHYQLGRVLEEQGRTDEARDEFRTVLAMPDRHDSHRMAREALGADSDAPPGPAPTGESGASGVSGDGTK